MTEAAAAPAPARETLEDVYVVDADVHIHEDPAELAEYADPPWDVGLREIAKVEERYLDLPGMTPRAEFRVPFPGGSNRRQIVTSAAEMRAGLDDLHVNKAVLFPDHLLYARDGPRPGVRRHARARRTTAGCTSGGCSRTTR